MVRTTNVGVKLNGKQYVEFAGLSTDTKPTDDFLATGCLFLEVNTGAVFAYDEAGEEWNQIAALGGGA